MSYPNPAEAVDRSVEAFENGDRDAARYWLDVARELRSGWRDKSQGYARHEPIPAPEPYAEAADAFTKLPDGREVRQTNTSRAHYALQHPTGDVCEHDPFLIGADVRYPGDVATAADVTALLSAATGTPCPSCGGETFRTHEGTMLHRKTYMSQCEFATGGVVGR